MDQKLRKKLEMWNRKRQPQNIIAALVALSPAEMDYDLTCQLARAYNNRRQSGDYDKAIALLLSVAEAGASDAMWHFRLGYAYFYSDRFAEALPAFEQALTLDGKDRDAKYFIKSCQKKLAKKQPPSTMPDEEG